jgi:carboxypeptidase PM20D1
MQTTPQLLAVTRHYFEELSKIEENEIAKWMRALDTSVRFELAVLRLSAMNPLWGAMLRDTVVQKPFQAGAPPDAAASESRAELTVYLLPGNSLDTVLAQMTKAVNDPRIRFEVQNERGVSSPQSSLESDLYQTIAGAASRQFEGAVAVPILSPVATDSAELRLRNLQAYGIQPFPLNGDEAGTTPGNQRLPASALQPGIEFMYRIVREFAAAQ